LKKLLPPTEVDDDDDDDVVGLDKLADDLLKKSRIETADDSPTTMDSHPENTQSILEHLKPLEDK